MNTIDCYYLRHRWSDQGTSGTFYLPEIEFSRPGLELPWRDNRRNVSCIPADEYTCIKINSNKFGVCFLVQDVDGRTGILTHWGNVAGDTAKGWRTHSLGCFLIGSYRGKLWGQKAVLASRTAFRQFMEAVPADKMNFKIVEAY